MKSNINLYSAEFKPKFEWITGRHLLGISIVVTLIMSGVYGGLFYWHSKVESQAQEVATQIAQEQQSIDDFTHAIQTRTGDPLLGARLNQLQNELSAQESLLLRVKDLSGLKQKSFSSLFDALASANSNHLWLTSFTVDEENLSISGSLAKPSAMTQWIGKLSNTSFFKGREFNDAVLAREDEALHFTLTSKKRNESADSANEQSSDVLVAQEGGNNGSD
uniref:PilN domain-containing protein n=1 Tax=Ningiella ruwaisensis TaxID=2364274 RepID=UPI0010A00F88|nr:PilN domain-containing protein [Ningiella ruwaisensis]